MKPYLFTATNAKGKHDSYMREAESVSHLLVVLEREGYADVELLSDEQTASYQAALSPAFRMKPGSSTRNHVEKSKQDQGANILPETIKKTAWLFILLLTGLAITLFFKQWLIAVFIIAAIIFLVYLVINRTSISRKYYAMHQAMAEARWEDVIYLTSILKQDEVLKKEPLIQAEIVAAHAKALAVRGQLQLALDTFSEGASYLHSINGAYDTQLTTLHYLAGQPEKTLEHIEIAYEKSQKDAGVTLDVAQLHARLGDVQRAKEMLEKVNVHELVAYKKAFYVAIKAIIFFRENNFAESLTDFERAHQQVILYEKNVLLWQFIGMIAAYYSVALIKTGHTEKAAEIISPWTHVINDLHENSLREELTKAGLI